MRTAAKRVPKPKLRPESAQTIMAEAAQQKVRSNQAYLSLLMYAALGTVACWGALRGTFMPWHGAALGAWCLAVGLTFVVLIRCGVNRKFSDPSLTLAQCYAAQATVAIAYLLLWPIRAATLLPALTTLVFALFALSPLQVRQVAAFSVGAIAAAMLAGLGFYANQSVEIELMQFIMFAAYASCVTTLSSRMSAMRRHLKRGKADLQDSLERIQLLATTDGLTGLVNRRHAMDLITHERQRLARYGGPITIAMLDIDHFKSVNDRFGHAAGDAVLKSVASVLKSAMRSGDVCSRWGGEEFLIGLPDTEASAAALILERVANEVATVDFNAINLSLRVTFSAGLVSLRADEALELALQRVDRLLYKAKGEGRNRIIA